jgi:hypothetical protein
MFLNRVDNEWGEETIYRCPLFIGRIIAYILNALNRSEYVEWIAHCDP